MIARMMDKDIVIKSSSERIRPENSEVERLLCDNSKLLMHTSWKQKYTLEQGIAQVIEWMADSKNLTFYKSENYNI